MVAALDWPARRGCTSTTRAAPRWPASTPGSRRERPFFDASIGGLGGCRSRPGATGNVATEDVVYLLERSGIATGLDLDALIATATWLAGQLGHDLPGRVLHAGPFRPLG